MFEFKKENKQTNPIYKSALLEKGKLQVKEKRIKLASGNTCYYFFSKMLLTFLLKICVFMCLIYFYFKLYCYQTL